MKKFLMMLLAITFIIAGCSGNDENENGNSNENNSQAKENGNKDVYQIGDTAHITSAAFDFPYEVTVNDFELAEEAHGKTIADFFVGKAPEDEDTKLAVVNVTIKNTGDEAFVPGETIYGELMGEMTRSSADNEIFSERKEKLKPGNEITGDLVYVSDTLFQDGVVYLEYESASDEKTRIELPVPKSKKNKGENSTNQGTNSEENKDSYDNSTENDSVESDMVGLGMGETGYVRDEDNKYEVTLNSVKFSDDDIGGIKSENDVYAIVNLTVENVGDHPMNAKNIHNPSFGETGRSFGTFNETIFEDSLEVEQDLLEGKISPGESTTGDQIYDITTSEYYTFFLGESGVDTSYAKWEIHESDVE